MKCPRCQNKLKRVGQLKSEIERIDFYFCGSCEARVELKDTLGILTNQQKKALVAAARKAADQESKKAK